MRDFRFQNGSRKYAYQWMDSRDRLRIRWDNARHWPEIATYPHHKHVNEGSQVLSSTETSLEAVLQVIGRELVRGGDL